MNSTRDQAIDTPGYRTVVEQLEAARGTIETSFVSAAKVLSTAAEGLGSLIDLLDALIDVIGSSSFRSTTDELTRAADLLMHLPEGRAQRRVLIGQLGTHSRKLSQRVAAMGASLASITTFSTYIKIAAAGTGTAGHEFTLIAQDILKSLNEGQRELETFESGLAALRGELGVADESTSEFESRLGDVFPHVPDALAASAQIVDKHHRDMQDAAQVATNLARDIRKRIARILSALQIGDITRQRMEHVQVSLAELDVARGDASDDARQTIDAVMKSLQSAQLSAAAVDFVREVSTIDDSMRQLAEDARALLRLSSVTHGGASSSQQGFLVDLEQRVSQALALVSKMEAADHAALTAGLATVSGVRQLSDQVDTIEAIRADVQLIALNMTLRCSRIGDSGKPLSVIAAELRAHSDGIEESVAQGKTLLEDLAQAAQCLTQQIGGTEEGSAQNASVALRQAAERIGASLAQTERDIQSLDGVGRSVLDGLEQSCTRLNSKGGIGEVLDKVAARLNRDAVQDPHPADEEIAATLQTMLAAVAARYTMAQERAVHASVLARWKIDAVDQPVAHDESQELDDVLF